MDENEASGALHPAVRGLKTVCRCNNIKFKTIERAIREGAHTLSQVASRTMATTGECGGSCTPDVQAMIEELAPRYATAVPPRTSSFAASAGAGGSADPGGSADSGAGSNPWWVRKK